MSLADFPVLICAFCEAKVTHTPGGGKLTEHLQVWHGITVKKEVEIVVEKALKQRLREELEVEEEEETVFQIRNSLEQGITKFMGTATSTNMQGATQQGEEGDRPVKLVHSNLPTSDNEEVVIKKFSCGLDGCRAKFAKRGHFKNHIKNVHGGGASKELEKQSSSSSLSPLQNGSSGNPEATLFMNDAQTCDKKPEIKGQRKVTCEECGMVMWKSSLKKHMTTNHTGNEDRPYKCDAPNCGARYVKSWLLKRHMKLFHKESGRGVKKTKSLKLNHCCKECRATFTTKFYLRRHNQMFHDGKEK